MIPVRSRQLGILLVVVSAVMWSTAGLFIRMADMDTWSFVFWRSLFTCAALGIYVVMRKRKTARPSFGWAGTLSTLNSVLGAITYIAALQWTSVANVMTVYAGLPFLATALAFVWLGERITVRFLLAGGLAFCGIALMVGTAVTQRDILGVVTAFVMTMSFAGQLVLTKRHQSLDAPLVIAIGAALCALIAWPLAQSSLPTPQQLLACALYGAGTTGAAYLLALVGGRMIGSGEAGFISMLDVVLGPLWVWLIYAEVITLQTILGGAVVLLAVVWYLSDTRQTVQAL